MTLIKRPMVSGAAGSKLSSLCSLSCSESELISSAKSETVILGLSVVLFLVGYGLGVLSFPAFFLLILCVVFGKVLTGK